MLDELLKKFGFDLKYDQLTEDEQKTLHSWSDNLSKKELTLGHVVDYVSAMRQAVEKELTVTDLSNKQDIFLKARLKNYMMLDAFLTSPIKAKEALEKQINSTNK